MDAHGQETRQEISTEVDHRGINYSGERYSSGHQSHLSIVTQVKHNQSSSSPEED